MAVRIGFIGCGGMAQAHMRSLASVKEAKMVAFCDVDSTRAESTAAQFGGAAYDDHRKMLKEAEIDAVYVCVTPHAHGSLEVDSVRAGKHLFVEKPVNISNEQSRKVLKEIEKAGVINSVGYHWRYLSATDEALKVLKDREIAMVIGYWMGGMPGVAWWRRLEQSGGQFVEQCTHIFDLARYLAGDVKSVSAYTALRALREVPNLNVPDVGTAALEFKSGAIGTISTTCILSQGFEVGLRVFAKDLMLHIDGARLTITTPARTEVFNPTNNPTLAEDQIFVNAVRSNNPAKIRCAYEDGAKSLAVTLAAMKSAANGRPILL